MPTNASVACRHRSSNAPMPDHPFWEGHHALDEGQDEYDNPHPANTWENAAWHHGLETALYEAERSMQLTQDSADS